jgi:hypothetical protein
MTEPAEPAESRPTMMPMLAALAVALVVLIVFFGLRFSGGGDPLPDDVAVGRAVVGQNDALQRGNYADFRTFTCASQQGVESQVLADQRRSADAKGARYVEDVKDIAVTGERATATVVYHFEKAKDDKLNTPMTVVREDGAWKVCSPGPR